MVTTQISILSSLSVSYFLEEILTSGQQLGRPWLAVEVHLGLVVVLKVVLPVTLISIRPCHLKQKVGEICQCNFHTVRNWSQLWTCNPCEFRRWDQNCGRLHTPRITVSQEWLNGSLTRIQGGKSGAWSLFYQVGTACSTRWARLQYSLLGEMRSIEIASGRSQWMGGGHCHQPSGHRWCLVLHPFLRLLWTTDLKQCQKVLPFCHILCPCETYEPGMWFPQSSFKESSWRIESSQNTEFWLIEFIKMAEGRRVRQRLTGE